MRLFLVIITLIFVITQNTIVFAKKVNKLYENKETIRLSSKDRGKLSIAIGDREKEFFYKDSSGLFPKRGRAYIQYYNQPDKATIIVNNRITADVRLAGIDTSKYYYNTNFYWELYDRFMINRASLYYVKVGRDKTGMHKVILYAKFKGHKVNINKWINRYCRIRIIKVAGDRGPVWRYKSRYWVEPRWKKVRKSMSLTSIKSRKLQ